MGNRSTRDNSSEPSVNLPIASIGIDERGAMRVIYDGREFPPPSPDSEWSRARFGELLDAISAHRTRTVRVEVHEFDGSVFTDIIRKERTAVEVEQPSAKRRARHSPTHQLVEITGSGFIPGEDITVALSISSTEGSADGSARGLVDLSESVDHRSEAILIGRVSGVIVSAPLPS
ncbi:hypothetical protein ACTU6V_13445 [Microbacterium sp. A204]|uniref:hypothetical protein n=1 Tax=Microbacterium sp. A204 TaxID=3457321 RepID=UPI003FD6B3A7